MIRRTFFVLMSMFCTAAGSASAGAGATADLITLQRPRGASQSFIFIKPDKPVASVILFPGGHGALGLKSATAMRWGAANFLVRTRDQFAAQGLMVAVMDAPSDEQKGMNANFRMSQAHADDIAAVAGYLKGKANVPVWLVGTSMGTFSAAEGAIAAKNVDGLVLTSTVTRSKPQWKIAQSHRDGVASMPLSRITLPTLIVAHRQDGCTLSPVANVPLLVKGLTKSAKAESVLLDGGKPPQSDPCEAKAQHGFWGIEDKAVGAIAKFVRDGTS